MSSHKFEGSGSLYLSTLRLVFINEKRGAMDAFDLPLATMYDDKFNQPSEPSPRRHPAARRTLGA